MKYQPRIQCATTASANAVGIPATGVDLAVPAMEQRVALPGIERSGDEHEIGPEVTVAAALPGPGQCVVAVPGIGRLVGGECSYDSAEDGVETLSVSSFAFSVVIALELTGQHTRSRRSAPPLFEGGTGLRFPHARVRIGRGLRRCSSNQRRARELIRPRIHGTPEGVQRMVEPVSPVSKLAGYGFVAPLGAFN